MAELKPNQIKIKTNIAVLAKQLRKDFKTIVLSLRTSNYVCRSLLLSHEDKSTERGSIKYK